MRGACAILSGLLLLALVPAIMATAGPEKKDAPNSSAAVVRGTAQDDTMRVEGERRFRSNCSRCHAAPHKFPPRMMATIVRHMRVRATITDNDMRLILYYMTQ